MFTFQTLGNFQYTKKQNYNSKQNTPEAGIITNTIFLL